MAVRIEEELFQAASSALRHMAMLLDAPSDPASAISEAATLARDLAARLEPLTPSEAKQELLLQLETVASGTAPARSLLSAVARAECVLDALARNSVSLV